MWNLFEAYSTPENFALCMVQDLNLSIGSGAALIMQITAQIIQQLQQWAPIALHPAFNGPINPLDPDESFDCIIELNLLLNDERYTDKFQWNLLHPMGQAEEFAQVLCADCGKGREWVTTIAHGINEAVMKQKKEFLESGGVVPEINNMAVGTGAIRHDPEGLGAEWEPGFKKLTRDELDKREGDRERERRRQRRERATGYTTTTAAPTPGYFDLPETSDTPMGRGARNRKQRRFLSPGGRDGTPGGGTPDGPQQAFCGAPTDVYVAIPIYVWNCADILPTARSSRGAARCARSTEARSGACVMVLPGRGYALTYH